MYHVIGSPKTRASRIIWMLEELGAAYEVTDVGPHSDAVLKVNPGGKVPVLVDGDLVVTDSTAILCHLSDKHNALTFPAGSPERAKMMSLLFFALDEIEGALWTAAKHEFALPENLRAAEAIGPACRHEWTRAMATLETRIGEGPFAMGETFTLVDIVLGHLGGWGKAIGFEAPPRVADYISRVRARPAWRAVVKKREEG